MLHFKEFLPTQPPEGTAIRVFIDAGSNFAAVIHGAPGCENPKLASDICREALEQLGADLRDWPLAKILLHLQQKMAAFSTARLMAFVGIVRFHEDSYEVAVTGKVRLVEFSHNVLSAGKRSRILIDGASQPTVRSLPIPRDGIYILASDGLNPHRLAGTIDLREPPSSNRAWRNAAERATAVPDWAIVVFPFEQLSHYGSTTWPYDPFIGRQEESDHERRGLSEIASTLFRSKVFPGFRIVGGIAPNKAHSSYLADGVLIIPEGIVLLELKDHSGRIEIPLESDADMRVINNGGSGARHEPNPVSKLKRNTRLLSDWGKKYHLNPWQTKMAVVAFTNPACGVIGMSGSGKTKEIPLVSGEVMVTSTRQLPIILKQFIEELDSKCPAIRLKPEQIEVIANKLAKAEIENRDGDATRWSIGQYTFDSKPGQETGYYTRHPGKSDHGKSVWLKRYPLKALFRGDRAAALQSLGREARALQDLPADPRLERLLDSGELPGAFYTIIEAVDGPDLASWLSISPSRAERLAILRDLAELLAILAEEAVVHRSITPNKVLVRSGRPVLTGFEMARLDEVTTLMIDKDRLLDHQYLPAEEFTGGARGCATDTYSFGAIAIKTLSGELPFVNYQELAAHRARTGYWEKITQSMGLSQESTADIKRLMATDPTARPVGRDIVATVSKWS